MVERMYLYSKGEFGDGCAIIYADEADRDYRDTDAGTDETFIVRASSHDEALRGARNWLAARADETSDAMPDGLHLEERTPRNVARHSYITLRVL